MSAPALLLQGTFKLSRLGGGQGLAMPSRRGLRLATFVCAVIGLSGWCLASAQAQRRGGAAANPTAVTLADFRKRIDDYMVLQRKLAATLPKLPKEATPQQIDQEQRALGMLVAQARATAKPGDLFTPDMQRFVHQQFNRIFQGRRGQELRRQIHDEPHAIAPEINKRYPDAIPLATMPLEVLAQLPPLPDELEYRFIQSHLIVMDVHAHLILDYVLNAIPEAAPTKPPKQGL